MMVFIGVPPAPDYEPSPGPLSLVGWVAGIAACAALWVVIAWVIVWHPPSLLLGAALIVAAISVGLALAAAFFRGSWW